MKVYVSGPITGLPIDLARQRFADAANELLVLGYQPVNPMAVPTSARCNCPDATGTEGTDSGHTWACYLRKDLRVLVDCDAILLLPGWEFSRGARLELHVAVELGLQVWWQMPTSESHLIEFRATGWTIQHPLACRPKLFDCPINRVAEAELAEPPNALGVFEVSLNDFGDRLFIGDRVDNGQVTA